MVEKSGWSHIKQVAKVNIIDQGTLVCPPHQTVQLWEQGPSLG